MAKIVAVAVVGLMAAIGMAQLDVPALGWHVGQQSANAPERGAPAIDMAAMFRASHR